MTDARTMEQIYLAGLEALKRELGPVGMVRFLQIVSNGRGDYSKERHAWLDGLSIDDIVQEIEQRRARDGESPP